jgi:hypothetical protein
MIWRSRLSRVVVASASARELGHRTVRHIGQRVRD